MIKLKQLIFEKGESQIRGEVHQLEKQLRQDFPQLQELYLTWNQPDILYLVSILIKDEERGRGIGKQVIGRLKKFADERNLKIKLTKDAYPGYKKKLHKFYSGLGFRGERGWPPNRMARNPLAEIDYRRKRDYAPNKKTGAPMYDLSKLYPADLYGKDAPHLYSRGKIWAKSDANSIRKIQSVKNHPNAKVVIYRAVPSSVGEVSINIGDWVTVSKQYAEEHGLYHRKGGPGKYKVITKVVYARDLFTDGDSIVEWGYDPQPAVISERFFTETELRQAGEEFMRTIRYTIEDLKGTDKIVKYLESVNMNPQVVHLFGDDYVIYGDYIVDVGGPSVQEKENWLWSSGAQQIANQISEKIEEKLNQRFWEYPQPLYHASPKENLESIKNDGLKPQHQSRSMTNRHITAAVFTTTEHEEVWNPAYSKGWIPGGPYGDLLVSINTKQMKADGYTPEVTREPAYAEQAAMNELARRIQAWEKYGERETVSSGDGVSPQTIIIHGNVPAKYLSYEV
jgi:hypothetical protein